MAVTRSKPYEVSQALNPEDVENMNQMFRELYEDLGDVSETVEEVQTGGGGGGGGSTIDLPLTPPDGGTGLTSYAIGDILFASSPTTLTRLPIGASGEVLTSTGSVPDWQPAAVPLSGYWAPLMTGSSLTGYPEDSEMVLDADGDAIMVFVST